MNIINVEHLYKIYGEKIIFDDASFGIQKGDKIGIVGINGTGKSTLLKMIAGEETPDKGQIIKQNGLKLAYVPQNPVFSEDSTIRSYALKKGEENWKVESNLTELNITRFDQKIEYLSGGQKKRVVLAKILSDDFDVLLLDEPTNHLDIGTLKWLEQYLEAYRGTIMIVSHDRYFLDRTVNRIFEVENHKVYSYQGKYSDYAAQKKLRRETELRAYNNQQREIARQEEMIRRMKQRGTEHLAKRAASREKRLDMLERIERPESEMGKMKINFKENFPSGGDVIMAENLEKSFGRGAEHRELFHGVNLDIKRGERICILGPNGVGKTTLLRVLLGELAPDAGYLKIGHNVAFGYYDQGQLLLSDANTVLEELKESYRLYTDTEMRSILGRFLFRGEEVFLPVGSLSGGEKARLSLLKLMLSGANTLILDEPTNHLDIESKEVFEEALMEFPGTVIVVSHDRYFLQRIPTRILELTQDGVIEYLGRYDYYLEKKSQGISAKKYFSKVQEKPTGDAAQQRRLKKEREAEERRRARLSEKLETEISELENQISELEQNLCKPENMSDYELLARLGAEREETEKRLAEAYDEWAKVQEA